MLPSMFDPSDSNPIVLATAWIQEVLLGSLATGLAVIAVAWFGIMMLQGSVSIRRGAQLIFGCFILFGSATIAQGLEGLAQRTAGSAEFYPPSTVPAAAPQPAPELVPYDPYAGASVPVR